MDLTKMVIGQTQVIGSIKSAIDKARKGPKAKTAPSNEFEKVLKAVEKVSMQLTSTPEINTKWPDKFERVMLPIKHDEVFVTLDKKGSKPKIMITVIPRSSLGKGRRDVVELSKLTKWLNDPRNLKTETITIKGPAGD